jgi:hypothetical protein
MVNLAVTSSDTEFGGDPWGFTCTNKDDDVMIVDKTACNTTEAGGTCAIGVKMRSWDPAFMLTMTVAHSLDAFTVNGRQFQEGTAEAAQVLTWDALSWNITRTLLIRGNNDFLDDGDVTYNVILVPTLAVVGGGSKMPARISVSITNIDDDTAGIGFSQPQRFTTEAGGRATFGIFLTSEPYTQNGLITLTLRSSDLTEGVLTHNSVTFSATSWNVPQYVTVVGQDDQVHDYDQNYTIIVATSALNGDAQYQHHNHDLVFTNKDDDEIGLHVIRDGGAFTSENTLFSSKLKVWLNSEPKDTVLFTVMSSDPTEASTAPNILAFSATTWMSPQEVLVLGVDDPFRDKDKKYKVVVKTLFTDDPDYGSITTGMLSADGTGTYGMFTNLDDITDVSNDECPIGMWGTISEDTAYCRFCPPGEYSDTTKNVTTVSSCKKCFYGTFQPSDGAASQRSCTPCPLGKYSDLVGSFTCKPCDNVSYCGMGSVVPLLDYNITQMTTSYQHGWKLVEAAGLSVNWTYYDIQYLREDSVVTENSIQILWFGACTLFAMFVILTLAFVSHHERQRGTNTVHNFVRSCDMFNDEHDEDLLQRYQDDAEEEMEESKRVQEDVLRQEGLQRERFSGRSANCPLGPRHITVEPVVENTIANDMAHVITAMQVVGGGVDHLNGDYTRDGKSDGVPRFVSSIGEQRRPGHAGSERTCISRFNLGNVR